VGVAREPRRFLAPGEVVESTIEGIGTMRNRML
jgi:2-keto-4-pentenoate hydratase/2-oxohepta-3-ene-1,7-dioic acid hydratase in catechol pathway